MTTDNSMEAARDFFAENSKPQDLQVHKRKRPFQTCTSGLSGGMATGTCVFYSPQFVGLPHFYILVVLRQLCDYCDTSQLFRVR